GRSGGCTSASACARANLRHRARANLRQRARPPAPASATAAASLDRMAIPDATGRVRAVVFDLGGGLLAWHPGYLYRKLFGGDEAAMERFLAEVCTMEWHHAHDLGMPPEQTCTELARAHPEHEDLIWAWSRRSEEMIGGPIDGTVQILAALKAT